MAEIQPKNHQNVQKRIFLQKAPRVNGLKEQCHKDFAVLDQFRAEIITLRL